MNLNNIRISTLLAMGFAALVIMVVFMAGFGLLKVKGANMSINTIYDDRVVPLKQLKQVSDMYASDVMDTAYQVSNGLIEPKAAAPKVKS